MIKRGGLILIVVLFLFIIPSVSALSLAGQKLGTITYRPGLTITNHYSIFDTDKPVEVVVDGAGIFELSVSEVIDNEFDLSINFPADHYIPPGSYNIGLTIKEISPPEAGISSQVAVSKSFEVVVYSYEKDIQASLYAANINQGKNATFQLGVQSNGYPDIEEVYARINLFNSSRNKVGSIETERRALPGLESITFTSSYDTQLFSSGNYYAEALVFYDGKYETANTTFLIGIMDIILNNYTASVYPGFNHFEIFVTNGWGNELRNVYAELFMEGQKIVQTPSINLGPWQQSSLKSIINIDLPAGNYGAILKIYFESENKEIPILVTILSWPEPQAEMEKQLQITKVSAFIPAILSTIIIIVIMGIYLLRKKRSIGSEL